MGMGVMLWEWEGAGTLKLIPAHLYLAVDRSPHQTVMYNVVE